MNKIFIPFLLLFLISGCLYSQNVTRDYVVKKTTGQINIDGKIEEKEWNSASSTQVFIKLDGTFTWGNAETRARMLWDDNYLYLLVEVIDTLIYNDYSGKDATLFNNDCFELFLDPDGDGLNYVELGVSPTNGYYDLLMTKPYSAGGVANKLFDIPGVKYSVGVDSLANDKGIDRGYVVEMAIPFTIPSTDLNKPIKFAKPNPGDMWRANLCRVDVDYQNNGPTTFYEWNYTGGNSFHSPKQFGKLVFSDKQLSYLDDHYFTKGIVLCPHPYNETIVFSLTSYTYAQTVLRIYDIDNKEIDAVKFDIHKGTNFVTYPGTKLPMGTYSYMLSLNGMEYRGKLSVAR